VVLLEDGGVLLLDEAHVLLHGIVAVVAEAFVDLLLEPRHYLLELCRRHFLLGWRWNYLLHLGGHTTIAEGLKQGSAALWNDMALGFGSSPNFRGLLSVLE